MAPLLSPLIAAIVPAAAAGTALNAALTAVVTLGLGLGQQLLFRPRPQKPKPQDVKGTVRMTVTARSRHYGKGRIGGSEVFVESIDGDLWKVIAFGQGPWEAIDGYYIDENPVEIDVDGMVTSDPYTGTDDDDGPIIFTRLGTVPQTAFAELIAVTPKWTADHMLTGVACGLLGARAVEPEDFQRFYPNLAQTKMSVVARTCNTVYDPRTETTGYTANLALCLRDYLVSGDGARCPADMVDDDIFAAAADICDENVPKKGGGTVKRYHGQVSYSLEDEPRDVIERFLGAMDGRLYFTGEGRIGLIPGKWVAPTVHLTDDHVLLYDLDRGNGPHRAANEIIIKYTQVEADYAEATADPWRNEASISQMGLLSHSYEMYEVQEHNQTQRLAKILEHRSNPKWTGSIQTNLAGLRAYDQRWITLTITELGIVAETFEVTDIVLELETASVAIQLQSFSSSAYDFDPETEEGDPPAVPPRDAPTTPPAPTPGGVVLEAIQRVTDEVTFGEDVGLIRVYVLRLTYPAKPGPSLRVEAEYRDVSTNTWRSLQTSRENNRVETPSVARGETYEARIRYYSAGKRGPWEYSNQVMVPGTSS